MAIKLLINNNITDIAKKESVINLMTVCKILEDINIKYFPKNKQKIMQLKKIKCLVGT